MFYFVVSFIVILAILGIFIMTIYNKFQITIIKINKAENNLDSLFNKRKVLLLRTISNIEENDELKEMKDELDFDIVLENHFEAKKKLFLLSTELFNYLDSISKTREIDELLVDFERNDLEIDSAISYYNDQVVIYNRLIKCFPSNLVSLIFHYQKKSFYEGETKEIDDIIVKS